MMPRFKDKALQRFYENCRRLGNIQTSEFYHAGIPRRGATHRVAYWNGRSGAKNAITHSQKNSFSYAAYCAGEDDRKDDVKKRNAMPLWTLRGNYMYPPPDWRPM